MILATPPASHYALAKRVLEAGKNIWIEKPLALRLDEGRELVKLAGEQKRVLFVDHTFLYDDAVRLIQQMIGKGDLGTIYHLFLQRLNLGRIKRDSNVWWNSAPHDASILLHLLPGRPTNVQLHGYRYLQPHLEDLNMAIVEMSDGASAFIYHNWLYPENTARVTVVGSNRLLVYEGKFEKRSITVYEYELDRCEEAAASGEVPTTIPSKIVGEHELQGFRDQEPLAAAVKDFIDSIREDRMPLSDGKFSLNVLAVLDAGEKSLRANGSSNDYRSWDLSAAVESTSSAGERPVNSNTMMSPVPNGNPAVLVERILPNLHVFKTRSVSATGSSSWDSFVRSFFSAI